MDGVIEVARSGRGARWIQGPMTAGQQALAAKWVEMAEGWGRRWGKVWPNLRADFASAALLALCQAAQNFDESKGAGFYTYLKWHLACQRKEVLRSARPKGYRVSGDLRHKAEVLAAQRPVFLEIDSSKDASDGDRRGGLADFETREWARRHLADLSPDHLAAVHEHFWEGRNLQEVADEWGCSREDVAILVDQGLVWLRRVARAQEDGSPLPVPPPPPLDAPQEPERMALGPVLEALRRRRNLDAAALADRAGMAEDRVRAIEAGEVPTQPEAVALAAALGQHPSLMLGLAGLDDPDDPDSSRS